MDGTPKAKLRRQSLPSQHYLSPSGLQDDGTEYAERLRFRDEMGIEAQSSYANQQAYNAHLNDPSLFLNGNGKLVHNHLLPSTSNHDQPTMKQEEQDVAFTSMNTAGAGGSADAGIKKKVRKKWTIEETKMLVDGCNKHGVGNWKSMLDDTELTFDPDRTPVDLKDRFRTYFPEAYRHLYPNAKTHLSSANSNRAKRTELPDSLTIFEKSRSKKRRPFTKEEDEALRDGFEKHGTVWAVIAKSPALASRRSTDLRDRFRNAFPDLYEKAGYKPRPTRPVKKKRGDDDSLLFPLKSPDQNNGFDRSLLVDVTPDQHQQHNHVHVHSTGMSMDPPQHSGLPPTPEEGDSFDGFTGAGLVTEDSINDLPKTPLMDTDQHSDGGPKGHGVAAPGENGNSNTNATLSLPPSSNSSNVPSRQRSPSNAQNNNERNEYFSSTQQQQQQPQSPHLHAQQQQQPQSPHLHAQQQQPQQQQPIPNHGRFNAAWYSERWLSGTQGYGEHISDSGNGGFLGSQPHFSHLEQGYAPGSGLGLNGLGNLTHGGLNGLDFEFGLSAGGWANQQTIIDRYDLPSSSSQLLMHSDAAIGDTGSSISGLDDYNANANMQMPLSSHHRYAGDLFHGRGVGFGGQGGFLLGGTAPDGMPSFARAGMDLGALAHQNASRSSSAMGAGMGIAGLNLGSATHSPELPQGLRHDHSLDSIEHLEAVLGNSILGSPSSVDPSKTLLHDVSTPPPGTPGPSSPPTRSFSSMGMYGGMHQNVNGSGAGLVRHSSMGGEAMAQDPSAQIEGRHYHQNHHQQHPHHQPHHHPGPSHSRSFSQPPSESRLQMGMSRPTTTTAPSPVKSPFQSIDGNGYGIPYDALIVSGGHSPMHQANNFNSLDHGDGFSPVGTPNQSVQSLPHQNQSPSRHPHPQLHHTHSHQRAHSPHSHQHHHHHSQQQRTPVQSHAQLHAFNSMYPPTSPSLFGTSGSSMGNLSAAAMALDLHGFQTYQHNHMHGGHHANSMGSPGLSPGTSGMASYHQMMDQYLDFDTNALDLATAVQPSASGSSFASFSHPGNSPQAPSSAPSDQKQSPHSHTSQSSQTSQKHPFQSPIPSPHHPTDSQSPAHFQNMFNYGNSMGGMVSMDDSMITQSTYPLQSHQQTGNPRRESFSYGTTGTAQPMTPSMMIPLNRVHSAGSTGGSSSWQPNGGNHSFSTASNVGNSRDATMKVRNPKRSSWGVLRSLAGSS